MASPLGEFEQLILLAVVRLGEGAYGVAIRRAIEEGTGRRVSAGAVYTTLGRLETRQLVASRLGETAPERSGQKRKYYRLLPAGAVAVRTSYEGIRRMARGVLDEVGRLAAQAEGEGA